MTRRFLAIAATMILAAPVAYAGFGPMRQAFNVRVTRIYSGTSITYVEFTALPDCINGGGYLTASWAAANGGSISEDRTKQIMATLLYAKAAEATMEVRYRLNDAPTGWDSCAIDAVFLN